VQSSCIIENQNLLHQLTYGGIESKQSSSFIFGLKPCDFRELVERKQKEYFQGSREWLFEEVREWVGEKRTTDGAGVERNTNTNNTNNTNNNTKRVFWLVGGAGTGPW